MFYPMVLLEVSGHGSTRWIAKTSADECRGCKALSAVALRELTSAEAGIVKECLPKGAFVQDLNRVLANQSVGDSLEGMGVAGPSEY